MLYIHIKKRVTEFALKILTKRIVEHADGGETRVLKKHNKKGKFSYRTWISTKAMDGMSEDVLYEKLLKITRKRTRSATIVVRQKMIKKGNLHKLWDTTFSLL